MIDVDNIKNDIIILISCDVNKYETNHISKEGDTNNC